MGSLVECQLSLEKVGRELRTSGPRDARDAWGAIRTAEKYVHDIVEDWEIHGVEITEGVPTSELTDLNHLQSFLGPAEQGFLENATKPMELLEGFIRAQLRAPHHQGRGSSSPATSRLAHRQDRRPADSPKLEVLRPQIARTRRRGEDASEGMHGDRLRGIGGR
jgi:hypothetical protein